jgi:chaperone modulatory protein CbpM
MTAETILRAVCLGEDEWLDIEQFARACDAQVEFIRALVEEGLIAPPVVAPAWRFGGEELARVRRIRRLQLAFEANLQSVAVMLDLLDEIERLRAGFARSGVRG